jgi:hypothetical protein
MRFPSRGIDSEFDVLTALLVLAALGTAGFFVATLLHHPTARSSPADAPSINGGRFQPVTVTRPAHTVVHGVVRSIEDRPVVRYATRTVTRPGTTHVIIRTARTPTVRQTRTVPVTQVRTQTKVQTQTVTQRTTVTQPIAETVVSTLTVTVTTSKNGPPPKTTTG